MILNRVEMIVVAPDFPYVVGAGVLGSWLAVVWHGEDTSFYLGCVLITDLWDRVVEGRVRSCEYLTFPPKLPLGTATVLKALSAFT